MTSLRIFLALSTQFDSGVKQIDVTSAFLYGKLDKPVLLELPQGHPKKKGPQFVGRLGVLSMDYATLLFNGSAQ